MKVLQKTFLSGRHKKKLLLLLFLVYFTAVYLFFSYTGIRCVFLHLFGIPCPGCGMTRALMSVLRLDIIGAVKHNLLIFFMPYILAYIFFDFKNQKLHKKILIAIGILAALNWGFNVFKTCGFNIF